MTTDYNPQNQLNWSFFMQTKVRIRKELFLAIYYNEHFSANDLKSFPLDSDEKEYLSDEYVEKIEGNVVDRRSPFMRFRQAW